MTSEEQRKANRKLGLILALVAATFAIAFFIKVALVGPG